MTSMSVTQARAGLADILEDLESGGECVEITRHGKAVAVLVGVEELQRLQALARRAERGCA